jgi:hypothetical protein
MAAAGSPVERRETRSEIKHGPDNGGGGAADDGGGGEMASDGGVRVAAGTTASERYEGMERGGATTAVVHGPGSARLRVGRRRRQRVVDGGTRLVMGTTTSGRHEGDNARRHDDGGRARTRRRRRRAG